MVSQCPCHELARHSANSPKAKQFALLINNVDFQPGGSWVQRFKERRGTVYKTVTSEGATLDMEAKQKWVEDIILDNYVDTDVFNGDETGLLFQMLPSKTHALKGDTCKGGKNSKLCLTVILCTNMDGSNKRAAFVNGISKASCCFCGAVRILVCYRYNSKAWTTRELFCEWLLEFHRVVQSERKVAFILDNCNAHHSMPELSSVEVFSCCRTHGRLAAHGHWRDRQF